MKKDDVKITNKIMPLFIILLTMVMTAFTFNIANATDTLPEVTVDVDRRGLYATETQGDVTRTDNILTRVSDVLLEGFNMYTYDSVKDNELYGTAPGRTITGDMGCVLKDTNGEPVTSLTVTAQIFINAGKSDVVDHMAQVLQKDPSNYESLVMGLDNVLSPTYGTYLEKEYQLTFYFNSDGTFSVTIPEDVPDNYILAITQMVHPVTGEIIDIANLNKLFLALGDASNSNPGEGGVNGGNGEDGGENPGGNPGEDDGHRYCFITPVSTSYTDLSPAISSSISSEIYDVETAIPTSENLKYSITADNAIYDIETRQTTMGAGVRDITIKIEAPWRYYKEPEYKYNASGDRIKVKDGKWYGDTLVKIITTTFSYSPDPLVVYDVPKSNIYPVMSGSLQAEHSSEYVLSSGGISLKGSDTEAPQVLACFAKKPDVSDVVSKTLDTFSSESEARTALNGEDGSDLMAEIRAAVDASFGYYGNVAYSWQGLNVTTTSRSGSPSVEKSNGSTTNMIPSDYSNGTYVGSGSVSYAGGYSFGTKPNDVVVHTPVVNTAHISWTSEFVNQKVNKESNIEYLMLDEQFTITIPNNGTHNSYKGYGERNYNTNQGVTGLATTWGKIKDIKFPFDVYVHYGTQNNKFFLKANTWLSESNPPTGLSLTANSYTFTVPVWVKEQKYVIETRVIAENAKNYALAQETANYSIDNYVATKNINCEVIGKIYDLRINASNDPGWTQVYSRKTRNEYIMANEFPFGQPGHNRVTQYKYAPKLGYTFVFNFKTKGRKSNNIDVSIQPEGFYFISKTGGAAQPVDLYYDSTTQRNIPIVPGDTTGSVTVRLTDAFMEVPSQEFVDSNRIYQQEYGRVYNYSAGVKIGNFAKTNLPHSLRLCYNNFAEYVNKLYGTGSTESSISSNAGTRDNVIGSVGHWWAGYRLPASTIAVPKGTTPTADKSNALKNGYILVKFNIVTKSPTDSSTDPVAGEPGNNYLRYLGPEALNEAWEETGTLDPTNKWPDPGNSNNPNPTHPGETPTGTPVNYPNGSVAIFDADLKSSNDSEVGGTH